VFILLFLKARAPSRSTTSNHPQQPHQHVGLVRVRDLLASSRLAIYGNRHANLHSREEGVARTRAVRWRAWLIALVARSPCCGLARDHIAIMKGSQRSWDWFIDGSNDDLQAHFQANRARVKEIIRREGIPRGIRGKVRVGARVCVARRSSDAPFVCLPTLSSGVKIWCLITGGIPQTVQLSYRDILTTFAGQESEATRQIDKVRAAAAAAPAALCTRARAS